MIDTSIGLPGRDININVYHRSTNGISDQWNFLRSAVTNFDGRTDEQIIPADQFQSFLSRSDQYFMIEYDLKSYFYPQTAFFPKPEIMFEIKMNQRLDHFHVVLLCTPFTYTTDVSPS